MQTGTGGPRCIAMKWSPLGSRGQQSRSHDVNVRFGDLAKASLSTSLVEFVNLLTLWMWGTSYLICDLTCWGTTTYQTTLSHYTASIPTTSMLPINSVSLTYSQYFYCFSSTPVSQSTLSLTAPVKASAVTQTTITAATSFLSLYFILTICQPASEFTPVFWITTRRQHSPTLCRTVIM